MVILGINVSHGASASLMINGEVILAFQEERFNKIKNFVGYPKRSIGECIKYVKNRKMIIHHAAFSTIKNPVFPFKYPLDNYFSIENWLNYYSLNFFSRDKKIDNVIKTIKEIKKKSKIIDQYLDYNKITKSNYFDNYKIFRKIQENYLRKQSGNLIKKISFLDHHTCHAYYAAYAPNIKEKKVAVVTLDSEGDGLNQTFWIFDRNKNKLKKINESSECDLARIYRFITLILKMKPNEHEYKVMGLAPYAKNEYSIRLYNDVFKNILRVKNCKVIHKQRPKNLFNYLLDRTNKYRFDNIAGAVQILVEKISSELINQISKKYKINTFSISGGVSMNIKMNKKLVSEKCAKKIYVAPTGTDESLSIGACYFINKYKNKYLKNIYLGQAISEETLTKTKLRRVLNKNFIIKTKVSHKEIAKLLKSGEIVAVARGREEFGARALGNRSILANPSVDGIVQKINEQIKNRDFWMPFALTIQQEKHKEFIMNKKSIDCDFMTIGFDTVKKNYKKIKNGTHPYDKSVRPQILKKDFNKNYHSIIEEFRKLTKIPALLNTSLNLHGMPISSQIDDILNTFKNSDLQYLYLEDDILIKKR
jgi:carbamoyltransferase